LSASFTALLLGSRPAEKTLMAEGDGGLVFLAGATVKKIYA
jgi:hypothetical protein